jgi:hypothetical protein
MNDFEPRIPALDRTLLAADDIEISFSTTFRARDRPITSPDSAWSKPSTSRICFLPRLYRSRSWSSLSLAGIVWFPHCELGLFGKGREGRYWHSLYVDSPPADFSRKSRFFIPRSIYFPLLGNIKFRPQTPPPLFTFYTTLILSNNSPAPPSSTLTTKFTNPSEARNSRQALDQAQKNSRS